MKSSFYLYHVKYNSISMTFLGDGYYRKTFSNCIEITVEIPPEPDPSPSPEGIPGYKFISLNSTILIITGVLILVLSKRNKLRK